MSIIPSTSLWKRRVTYLHGIPMGHGKTAPKCVKVHTGIERKRWKLVHAGTIYGFHCLVVEFSPLSTCTHIPHRHTQLFLIPFPIFSPQPPILSVSQTCVSTHFNILHNYFFPFTLFLTVTERFFTLDTVSQWNTHPLVHSPPHTFPALCHFECWRSRRSFILLFSFHGHKVRITEMIIEGIRKAGKFTVGKESEKTGVSDSL